MKIYQSVAEHTSDPEFCLGITLLYINTCNNAKFTILECYAHTQFYAIY